MSNETYSALIVAAGRGERAGSGLPKQFRRLAAKPVVWWSVDRFAADPQCGEILIAYPPGAQQEMRDALSSHARNAILIEGGATRTHSVQSLLAHARTEYVFIHDAARPLLSQRLIDDLFEQVRLKDGAAPALPVIDALVRDHDGALEPVARDQLYRLQTPQAFHTGRLKDAFKVEADRDWPDEVSLARISGIDVGLVPGEENNFKLTWPADFDRAERVIAEMIHDDDPKPQISVTGMGYDVHRLEPGNGIHLCGVFIPCEFNLVGHSDADAGLHAITDALLGSVGLGDIGDHFPPSDDQWKGADSAVFLSHARHLAEAKQASIEHVDVTLICERPKIGPHKSAMKTRIAELLGLPEARVNVKATTTEKLGFTGRGEGLAAEAVVTVSIPRAST